MTTQLDDLDFTPTLTCHTTHQVPVEAEYTLTMACPTCAAPYGFTVCGWCAKAYMRMTYMCAYGHTSSFEDACTHRVQIGVEP